MRRESRNAAGLGLVTMLALVGSAVALQAQEPPEPAVECRVELDQQELPIRADPVSITAAYSEVIGELLAAELPEESGIEVVTAEQNEDEETLSVRLTLRTTEAVEGDWTLTVRGEDGACTGQIRVRAVEGFER